MALIQFPDGSATRADLNTDQAWESGELGTDQAHVGKLSPSELASDIATIKSILGGIGDKV